MSNSLKIVMVGGGSYNWCPRLLSDLVQTPELEGSEVHLLDIVPKYAEDIKAAFDRICKDNDKDVTFVVSKSEEDAFTDADFVLITISTGGLDMMEHDLVIPETYGIYQTVGDTCGPGGWARSLRNVPVFTAMAEKIERLSPRAVILNYTNPMACLTGAIEEACSLRHVGLCHGKVGTVWFLSQMLGVPEADIAVRYGGVNHFFWITDITVNGRDGYDLLEEVLDGESLLKFDKASEDPAGFSDKRHRVFNELYQEYGYLNYVADRHTCEFFTRYLTDPAVMKQYELVRTYIEDRRKGRQKAIDLVQDMISGKQKIFERSRETAVDIMKAMVTNTSFIDVVNLPNIGQVDNLPRGAVVETEGLVDGNGFTPLAVGELPPVLWQLTQVHCQVQLMTLEAALTGDHELAMEALMLDPLCAKLTPPQVRQMGSELLAATADYLPQFR